MISTNTIAAANVLLAIGSPVPTVSNILDILERPTSPIQRDSTVSASPIKATLESSVSTISNFHFDDVTRATSESEKIIGEIRQWRFLDENWDGEGAHAPSAQSIKEAVSFVRFIKDSAEMPEPMLHATGSVSLYWDEKGLYADIEFLGDGRVAYFIKSNSDKHKGVLSFDSQKMPAVFSTLIGI